MAKQCVSILLALLGFVGCGGNMPARDVSSQPTHTAPPPSVTPTAALAPGANIGFLGVLRADDTLLDPVAIDALGRSIYERSSGNGFVLVIDAKPGGNRAPVGISTFDYDPTDPTLRPDLELESSRHLGDGSSDVCDDSTGHFGGVPGVDPPDFSITQPVSDALNDLGCRFDNGAGSPQGRNADSACVLFPDGNFRFVDSSATVEFCGTITRPLEFPDGDTIVTARVRDIDGELGPPRQIVIRVSR